MKNLRHHGLMFDYDRLETYKTRSIRSLWPNHAKTNLPQRARDGHRRQ